MKIVNKKELKRIKAGGQAGFITAGIIAGVTFLVGIFDGYFRPYKCR